MRRIIILSITLLFSRTILFGDVPQSGLAFSTPTPVTLPSPEAMAFQRYGDYPVTHNSGLIDISIPLWEVKSGSLSLPISMSSHASGRRVDDVEGALGFAWTLNAGGVINQKIKGLKDGDGTLFQTYLNKEPTQKQISDAAGGFTKTDFYRDIYSYSIPGSGKFIYDKHGDVVTIPYNPIKIVEESVTYMGDNGYGMTEITYEYFKILDVDGTSYLFGKNIDNNDIYQNQTTWYLSAIVSANKQDTIRIEYEDVRKTRRGIEEYIEAFDNTNSDIEDKDYPTPTYVNRTTSISYTEYIPRKIKFKDGFVEFIRNNSLTSYVDTIVIHRNLENEGSSPFRKISFNYSPKVGDATYSIDQMVIQDAGKSEMLKYNFEYYRKPNNISVSPGNVYRQDWWGYYNGEDNSSIMPEHVITYTSKDGNGTAWKHEGRDYRRISNEEAMKVGMIKSITYPTGGTTEFSYEQNVSSEYGKVGGLRIRQVKSTDNQGNVEYKTYEYPGGGYMPDIFAPKKDYMIYKSKLLIFQLNGVEKFSTMTRTRYTAEIPSDFFDFTSQLVYYNTVIEYLGTPTDNVGKVEYTYRDKPYFKTLKYNRGEYATRPALNPADTWKGGEISSKTEYRRLAGKSYTPEKMTIYSYYDIPIIGKEYWDWSIARNLDFLPCQDEGCYMLSQDYEYKWVSENQATVYPIYGYAQCVYNTGFVKLKEERIRLCKNKDCYNWNYDPSFESSTKYTYDHTYLNTKSQSVVNSDGVERETRYTYPTDYSGVQPYDLMTSHNIVKPVVEQTTYVDSALIIQQRSDYRQWSPHVFAPYQIVTHKANSNEETRARFNAYDSHGNPLQFSQQGGAPVTYIWGYSYQHVVAEIRNATYEEVAEKLGNKIGSISAKLELNQDDINVLNQLRDYLPHAQINTYTYEPMVGIKTHTDIRGLVTTYAYDGLGRLVEVRDHNDNILQAYEYNYVNR